MVDNIAITTEEDL